MHKSILSSVILSSVLTCVLVGCDLSNKNSQQVSQNSQSQTVASTQKASEKLNSDNQISSLPSNGNAEIQTTSSGLKYQIHSVNSMVSPKNIEYTLEILNEHSSNKVFPSLTFSLDEMLKSNEFAVMVDGKPRQVIDTNGLFGEGLRIIKKSGVGKYTLYLSYSNNIPPFASSVNAVIPANSVIKFNINAK